MEWVFANITIILAAIAGGIFRIMKVKSNAKTWWGRILDNCVIMALSVACALLFLPAVMHFFGIAIVYESFCAAVLALTSERIVTKFMDVVRDFNLGDWIKEKFKSK